MYAKKASCLGHLLLNRACDRLAQRATSVSCGTDLRVIDAACWVGLVTYLWVLCADRYVRVRIEWCILGQCGDDVSPTVPPYCTCAQKRCWCSYTVTTRRFGCWVVPLCLAIYICSRTFCLWGDHTSGSAAKCGQLDTLQWRRCQHPPCPWSKKTCAAAAGSGHLQVLQ